MVHYLETQLLDPFYNLAFEEFVLENRKEGDYLLLWQNENTVVIGQNQNAEAEINRTFINEHHIHVVRRRTGGGAVYHDLGNLNYSFITDVGAQERLTMERFTAPVVAALRQLGLSAEASGRNDILVDGKKVSGTAQRIAGSRILHHGTLLFDSNPDMVTGALQADPEKFRSKGTQSMRSRIGNIRSFLPNDMDLPTFWTYLKTKLSESGLQYETLTDTELHAVEALAENRYRSWEWNFGHAPQYDFTNKRRFQGGTLEVGMRIAHGKIMEIKFYGDFLSRSSLDPLEGALCGCLFQEESVCATLNRFACTEYFGEITPAEVLSVIFNLK